VLYLSRPRALLDIVKSILTDSPAEWARLLSLTDGRDCHCTEPLEMMLAIPCTKKGDLAACKPANLDSTRHVN
jgi:hypothetical protein